VQNCILFNRENGERWLLKITEGYKPKHIYNADETMLFVRFQPNKTMSLKWNLCNGGKNSKKRIMILLSCNANMSDELPRYLLGKMKAPIALKMSESCP
jgi:hypothetical protein